MIETVRHVGYKLRAPGTAVPGDQPGPAGQAGLGPGGV